MSSFTGRGSRRHAGVWFQAISSAQALPEAALPPQHLPSEGPPPARVWAERDPAAAARLARARAATAALAADHDLPVENLLSPEIVRRLTWSPPRSAGVAEVRAFLAAHGARPWQVSLTADALTSALQAEPEPLAPAAADE
jgi:ribonuclease D